MSVSETEMREFFQKVVDQVAELSTQASRVEGLTQRVNELADRLRAVEDENTNLKHRLNQADQTIVNALSELEQSKRELDNERAVTQSLRDTIVQRDAGVVQLEQSFRNEQDAHKITTSERDDARTKVQEQENTIERLNSQINDISTERDTYRSKTYDLERENAELKQRLEKINSVLNPLRVISGDVSGVA